jgi:hypothetical protein
VDAYAYHWVKGRVNDWREYLHAADRKILMAAFHLDAVQETLGDDDSPSTLDLPIPIQAHFEGIMYSQIAAADQVAEAVNRGFELGLAPPVSLQTGLAGDAGFHAQKCPLQLAPSADRC